MDSCLDPLDWLGPDLCMKIFMCLSPADIVHRVSKVSRSWRRFGERLLYFIHTTTFSVKRYLNAYVVSNFVQ